MMRILCGKRLEIVKAVRYWEDAFYKAPGVKEEEEGGVHEEFKRACGKERVLIMGDFKPGVGLVVRVVAWDPRVLSSSPVGR